MKDTEPRRVAVFAEGDFDEAYDCPTLEDAMAFARGVRVGAGMYGAGSIHAYVLPDDVADMRADHEHAPAHLWEPS